MTVRSGYFEYGHALRDSRCPSSVLSDGTKPQPLDRPGSGCKLHLKLLDRESAIYYLKTALFQRTLGPLVGTCVHQTPAVSWSRQTQLA